MEPGLGPQVESFREARGQSGSGKTYSLGVILEQLLLETGVRLVVLDPNSDFGRLAEMRADADPALAERYQDAARGVAVYSAGTPGSRRLRLHAADMKRDAVKIIAAIYCGAHQGRGSHCRRPG